MQTLSRECLALHIGRRLTATDLIEVMEKLVTYQGVPGHIRSDNGSAFVARPLQAWLANRQVKTLYIEPASPWQNGHVESFHGSLRDECLDRELMLSVAEARVVFENYRRYYNEVRPHGGLATAHPPKPAAKHRVWLPILPASYTKSLIQAQKLIAVLPDPASHSFWIKLGDAISGLRKRGIDKLLQSSVDLGGGVIRIERPKYFQPESEESVGEVDLAPELVDLMGSQPARGCTNCEKSVAR